MDPDSALGKSKAGDILDHAASADKGLPAPVDRPQPDEVIPG